MDQTDFYDSLDKRNIEARADETMSHLDEDLGMKCHSVIQISLF